ncbi:MAG TPA: hypothetical protein VG347_03210 [Verrucomicrobiae bacterium]|nr:hypothetical protein [Verrucomicrobiae bacterium]
MNPHIIGLILIGTCSVIFTLVIVVLALRYILYSERPRRQSRIIFTAIGDKPGDGNPISGHWSHTTHHSSHSNHHSHAHDSGGGSHSHGGSDGGGHSGGGDSGGGSGGGGGH